MYFLSFYKMADVPEHTKDRLRELTFGRENDSPLYAWTYNEGRCWAATLDLGCTGNPSLAGPSPTYEGESQSHRRIVSWACLTFEVDDLPVVGVYTDPDHRGQGLGASVVAELLGRLNLAPGTPVYAVSELWPRWPEMLEQFGLVHFEWE